MIIFLCFFWFANAFASSDIAGDWYVVKNTMTNGTKTTEKEYLHLHTDHTFSIQLFVDLQKHDAFVKGLRIEGSGIWKRRENVLAIHIQKLEVPFAKEIYLISQESLRRLANQFKYKYQHNPLKIIFINTLTPNKLVIKKETGYTTVYQRQ